MLKYDMMVVTLAANYANVVHMYRLSFVCIAREGLTHFPPKFALFFLYLS